MRNTIVVDWEALKKDNNWTDEEAWVAEIKISYTPDEFKSLPGPMDEAELKVADKPDRAACDVCNKIMVQVRCETHPKAEGCSKCHLKQEHKE